MNSKVIFESARINYVGLSEELINDYLTMVNDPDIYSMISHNMRTFTYEEELEWLKDKKDAVNEIHLSMIDKETNEFIGNISLMHLDDLIPELGISITAKKQNNKYGREAIKAIMLYGQKKYNKDKYQLNVFKENKRAIRCYESIGFVKTNKARNDDEYHMICNL